MEREHVKLQEKVTKLEKELFKSRQELTETKRFYEERLSELEIHMKVLSLENKKLTETRYLSRSM